MSRGGFARSSGRSAARRGSGGFAHHQLDLDLRGGSAPAAARAPRAAGRRRYATSSRSARAPSSVPAGGGAPFPGRRSRRSTAPCGTSMPIRCASSSAPKASTSLPHSTRGRRGRSGHQRAKAVARFGQAVAALDQALRRQVEARPARRASRTPAHARGGAVVVAGDAGQHRDAAVPQVEQVAHRLRRSRCALSKPTQTVPAGAGHVITCTRRQPALAQELQQLRALADAAQRERVGAAGHQVHGLARLGVGVVVAGRDQQLQAGVGQAPLQRVDRLREDRVVDGREDRADGAAAMRASARAPRHAARSRGGPPPRRRAGAAPRAPCRAGSAPARPWRSRRRAARGDVVDGRQRGDAGWHGLDCTRLHDRVRPPIASARP